MSGISPHCCCCEPEPCDCPPHCDPGTRIEVSAPYALDYQEPNCVDGTTYHHNGRRWTTKPNWDISVTGIIQCIHSPEGEWEASVEVAIVVGDCTCQVRFERIVDLLCDSDDRLLDQQLVFDADDISGLDGCEDLEGPCDPGVVFPPEEVSITIRTE